MEPEDLFINQEYKKAFEKAKEDLLEDDPTHECEVMDCLCIN